MPKLIIPNAYELYDLRDQPLTQERVSGRYFYHLRFLWLLEPGDAIVLPQAPAPGFLSYLAELKQIPAASFHVVTSLEQLSQIITNPTEWTIQTCFFNSEILALSKTLRLSLDCEWEKFIRDGSTRTLNSKVTFRELAEKHHIPITRGIICSTAEELQSAIEMLLAVNAKVIVKQGYNASSKGNIGIALDADSVLLGASRVIIPQAGNSIEPIAKELWSTLIHPSNQQCIVEVYYPNKGTFTAQFWIPPQGQKPTLFGYSEILMDSQWTGIHMPPRELTDEEVSILLKYSEQFSKILQSLGYQGFICCDAILTENRKLLFTEINVRPGAETHTYLLTKHLLGDRLNQRVIFTRNCHIKEISFHALCEILMQNDLLLKKATLTGIVLLTFDETLTGKLEYLVCAKNAIAADDLEIKMIDSLKNYYHANSTS